MGDIPAPFDAYRDVVRPEWIDDNGHMNMGYYVVVFDLATDEWMRFVGLDRAHRRAREVTTFCLEAHVTYHREVRGRDPLRFTTRLLDFDAKRIHYIHEMYHARRGLPRGHQRADVAAREPADAPRRAHGARDPGAARPHPRRARVAAAPAPGGARHGARGPADDPLRGWETDGVRSYIPTLSG